MSKYFDGNYNFLSDSDNKLFKPNDNLICCNDLKLNTLGDHIANNLITPIEILLNEYKNKYYEYLLNVAKKWDYNFPLFIQSNGLNKYKKEIVYRYIESNIKYKLLISNEKLNVKNDIFYELNNLSKSQIIGIIFQIDMQKTPMKNYTYYENLSDNFNDTLYCYYVLNGQDISQSNAIVYEINEYNNIREITQILFNDLSLEVLKHSRLDRVINEKTKKTIYNHLIYKRFLYDKIKTIDQIKFMLFSCSILFTLGTTVCQDIDLLVYHKNHSNELKQIIKKYFKNDTQKIPLIDFHMKGMGEWSMTGKKSYLNEWFVKEWPNLYGSKNMNQTFFDPKYYYYFMGMKIISYKADIIRRVKRNRATAYTDLIMLDYFNGLKIKPYKLEREYWQNNKQYFYTDEDLIVMIVKILKNVVRWHNITLSAKRVYDYIMWPDDFQLNDHQLKKINDEIKRWNKNWKNSDNFANTNENYNKINLTIEPYVNKLKK